MEKNSQLLGISNAIVDVLSHVDEDFLKEVGAPPGSMTLIEEDKARSLGKKMQSKTETSGGSVANTIAGFANLGGKASYIGRVNDDYLGNVFYKDMKSIGVDVRLKPQPARERTASCHVLIDKTGQRTMQTHLGACTELAAKDLTNKTIGNPNVILLEGFLWDIPESNLIVSNVIEIASIKNTKIALSLSDSFCVDRHRNSFLKIIKESASIVFGNEDEFISLLEIDNFENALDKLNNYSAIFVITKGSSGSIIKNDSNIIYQNAIEVGSIKDTTGAGDAYTAGFLYQWTLNRSLQECAEAGTICSSEVIQKIGGRIDSNLKI